MRLVLVAIRPDGRSLRFAELSLGLCEGAVMPIDWWEAVQEVMVRKLGTMTELRTVTWQVYGAQERFAHVGGARRPGGQPGNLRVICGEKEGSCICSRPIHADGDHKCACGGSWRWDGDRFVMIDLPGVAWGW